MIANVENVIKWLEANNLDYWKVQLKDAENSNVFESDETDFASNVKRFREVMELSTGSRFFIRAKSKKGVNRGNFYEEFRNLETSSPAVSGTQQPIQTGLTETQVQEKINEALRNERNAIKMERLEAENNELKKDIKDLQTPMNRMLTKVEPYIGTIIASVAGKIFPQSAPIAMAGIERIDDEQSSGVEDAENMENDAERLQAALTKWRNADPDFISLIEAVAELAASGDATYTMAKNMLKR